MLVFDVTNATDSQRILGVINGESFNVVYSDALLQQLKDFQIDYESIEEVDAYEKWVDAVKLALKSSDSSDAIIAKCKDLMYNTKNGKYYIKVGTKVSKHPVPTPLVEVILESTEKNIDPTPVVKAWVRFLRNPNFTPRKAELFAQYITAIIVDTEELTKLMEEDGFIYEKAVERAQYRDVTITAEGLLVCKKYARLLTKGWVIDPETNEPVLEDLYKTTKTVDQWSGKVTETVAYPDFTEELTFEPPVMGRSGNAFLCGDVEEHIIKVGQKHTLKSWSQVNCNDNTSCVKGLHVGKVCRFVM
jgi:hypothetical protein